MSTNRYQPISDAIWREKYQFGDETREEAASRVVRSLSEHIEPDVQQSLIDEIQSGVISLSGRVAAGAGTGRAVTLINCFVSPLIQDSMRTDPELPGKGIMDALADAAYTQQMGGGIGMDFTPLRPDGAMVRRTGTTSRGPLEFMDMWDAMCKSIMSAGTRRGAMMGTLHCSHPDILEFIDAKRDPQRFRNFNVSVLVSDDFMKAVKSDDMWMLKHTAPQTEHSKPKEDGSYNYRSIPAKDLWDRLLRATYDGAEPGVIFIDRINQQNNLAYCETISCTNPCGEQPLPPNGACNLSHLNLALCVEDPFTSSGAMNWARLSKATRHLVRLLDAVCDHSLYPTAAQAEEMRLKRRIGIGFTGLGNALMMLGLHYDSHEGRLFANQAMRTIAHAAYSESTEIAKERGPFPLWDKYKVNGHFLCKLATDVQAAINKYGLRNGVLLTVAPTGTTSIANGNFSSGIEPVYEWHAKRKVRQADGSFKIYDAWDWGLLEYAKHRGWSVENIPDNGSLPPSFVTHSDISISGHLEMQAAVQQWVDASISKTINMPAETSFEDFQHCYTRAFELGLKGCTTYRPNPNSGRGQVIEKASPTAAEPPVPVAAEQSPGKLPMQEVADARRYRIKWGEAPAFYVTITNTPDGKLPFELFISSRNAATEEWTKALSLLITAIFRKGGDFTFIIEELKSVYSATGIQWIGGKPVQSLVAAIGDVIEQHLAHIGFGTPATEKPAYICMDNKKKPFIYHAELCPRCNSPLRQESGCATCSNCSYSNC